ncbi:hypothetical protein KIN20_013850 [Parelaphostrongylus tenuis]|uniref:non-specific serine/threonine protein kinase n=1 Tax=Parelaphostrongylus tenuis TaxID=148309 RepID=A0AAD5QNV4_PARTN|nr:hypothetical protein KIN20_013850 [Parelaphostrongylus tenuis]
MIDENVAAAAQFPIGKRGVLLGENLYVQFEKSTWCLKFLPSCHCISLTETSHKNVFPWCIFGNWMITRKIDEGGFGQVYKVENVVTKKLAALKAEPNEIEGGSALKLEMAVIRAITADGEKPHVPLVFHAAKRRRFCYMIMTLLGKNLKELRMHCPEEFMSTQTWSRIGIQCLYSVKLVHDYGFVHRDIKPNNFVVGHHEDFDRARLVHILDFGLSRSYAVQKEKKWVARRARGTAEFRGTLRYCSPNVHEKKEQGRRDDLWSLYYVLIELHCGLPWQKLRNKQKVEMVKMNISDKDLVLNFPVELHNIIPYLRTLDYYQRPNYSMFYDGLVAVMKRVGAKASDPYDWEVPEGVKYIEEQRKKGSYEWENAAEFFKSDPIKVNSPPPPVSKRRVSYELGKLSTLVSLDSKKQHSQQSRASSASPDVDKANFPSEETLHEMQGKLSLFYGVEEQAQPELKDMLLQFMGKDKEKENEIKQREKKLTSREGVREIKQKTGSIIKQKDRETQHEQIVSKEPAEKKVTSRELEPVDDFNMQKDEKAKIKHNAKIGSKDPALEKKINVMKTETETTASKEAIEETKAATTMKPEAADDVKKKKDGKTKIKQNAERTGSKEPKLEKQPTNKNPPKPADGRNKRKGSKEKA